MTDVRNSKDKLICKVGKADVVEIVKDGVTTILLFHADGRVEIINSPQNKAT